MELFEEAGLILDNGKFNFPEAVERVKIDIGLSVNAPQSQAWITADPGLFVLGFEPVKSNLDQIKAASSDWELKLSSEFIGSQIALLRTALFSRHIPEGLAMYVTKDDPGCSSLLEPTSFEIDRVERVSVRSLNEILEYFPFDRIPLIDHVKIDAQGADFEILTGATSYLDRIFAVTLEMDTQEYQKSTNSHEHVQQFMALNNFVLVKPGLLRHFIYLMRGYRIDVETEDPTYINLNQIKTSRSRRFFLYQRG